MKSVIKDKLLRKVRLRFKKNVSIQITTFSNAITGSNPWFRQFVDEHSQGYADRMVSLGVCQNDSWLDEYCDGNQICKEPSGVQ